MTLGRLLIGKKTCIMDLEVKVSYPRKEEARGMNPRGETSSGKARWLKGTGLPGEMFHLPRTQTISSSFSKVK